MHRQMLVRGVVGEALGDGPGPKHPVHLKAKVEVQPPGGMLVNHEQASAGRRDGASRLGGTFDPSLRAVGG